MPKVRLSVQQAMIGWHLKDLQSVKPNGLNVLTTFSCGGGSSMGYRLAGFNVACANDIDPEMAWHYKTNLKPKHYVLGPIKDLTKNLPSDLPRIDILDGSPPCSTFSTSGLREKAWGKLKHFREGQAAQVLDDLFFDFLDVVDEVKPLCVIAENVTGLVKGNAKGYLTQIFARLRAGGYSPQAFVVNATSCGVPQRRERVFIIAPKVSVFSGKIRLCPEANTITAGDALRDIVLSDEERADAKFTAQTDVNWWPKTLPGETYLKAVERAGLPQKLFSHCKLSARYASPTLTSNDTFTHWNEPRKLAFSEWKRLGSFPDDYVAKTPKLGKYLIGMSVPPFMMREVSRAVAAQVFGCG